MDGGWQRPASPDADGPAVLTRTDRLATIANMTFFAPLGEKYADRRTVLVTGATGVVGSALLPRLAARHRVIALAHRRITPGGVVTVHGDVTRPLLGLPPERYAALAGQVDAVVHAAADTDPALGPERAYRQNILGTRHVLDFAAACGATLHHVSAAFAHRTGGDYPASKRTGEQLVREAVAAGQRATIVRPSAVVGDAHTGEVASFHGLATLAAAVLTSAVPLLPLDPQDRIDTVPVDVLARALASMVDTGRDSGEYWITAGAAALTAERFVEVLVDVGERLGIPVVPPRLIGRARTARAAALEGVPAPIGAVLRRLEPVLSWHADPDVLPSDLARLPGGTVLGMHQVACAVEASATYLAYAKGLLPVVELAPRPRNRRRALAAAA
jgi:nucleoside-diphosphate-sugar epimerase